ncbi:LPS export ABC transporter periplasmic protein LptC [Rhodopila sp.]|jgi:lipopolysaccharide export system protein LptC|uniref:LPS export ABC transporter periplasmic protein LptC n=1 Tax=Rhodopila sp. TaxID=2480087 RepID=UPI002B5B273B|nr:LPS export ABC transporter periplasmic protein LptC [Rhodopila sp.]HVZ09871.1 LPS export ABC transporter periplasmic protein LptC [Rhodopila sp.]
MTAPPLASGQPDRRAGAYMMQATAARRSLPTPGRIARRRVLITLTKWLLPLCAMALLAMVALWPELERTTIQTRIHGGQLSGELEGGRMVDLRYNGVDEKGRPYTVTAESARQVDTDRIVLTMPKGDITLENGTWLMVTARGGTYVQKANQLDLVNDVTLYRDDGTTMRTQAATVDVKAGAAASFTPVHAEGPFGTLDAQGGFTLMDRGSAVDFSGPAHLVLNGTRP